MLQVRPDAAPKINIQKKCIIREAEAQRRRATGPRPHSGLMAETKCKSASLNRGGTQQEVLWHTHAPDGTSQVPHPGKVGEPSREEAAVTVLPADPAHNQANLALETFSARCWPAAWRSTCFPYTTVPTPKETWSTFFVEKIISPMSPRKNGSGRASFTGSHPCGHEARHRDGSQAGFHALLLPS